MHPAVQLIELQTCEEQVVFLASDPNEDTRETPVRNRPFG